MCGHTIKHDKCLTQCVGNLINEQTDWGKKNKTHENSCLPKHALTKPYQTHPARPINHLPWVLAAKLNGVPSTQTSRSLAEMLTSRRFMGVRRTRYRENSASTRKLLRKPEVPMKPRHTATTRCPVGLRDGDAREPDTSSYVAAVPPVTPPVQCAQLPLDMIILG